MEYRTLGRTGIRVSSLCLGAMMFGRYGNDDRADCIRMTHTALDAGVNFIDTADRYSRGESEEILGAALKGRRDEVVLSTKAHLPMGQGVNDGGSTRLWIMRAVEASLRRLGTDYIDVYIMHRPDPRTAIAETLGCLTDLVRQGKVRYVGSSTFQSWQIMEAEHIATRDHLARFAVEQAPYSLLFRDVERDVLAVTQRRGMGVMAWSPLASGLLTGRYRRGRPYAPGSRAARAGERGAHVERRFDLDDPNVVAMLEVVERIGEVADEAGIPFAHLAVAFALSHPAVTSAIVGPRTLPQLQDLLDGEGLVLPQGVLDALDAIVPPGTHVVSADRRWSPPWLDARARRRRHDESTEMPTFLT